jgi:orotate phosphoribosyltransferase
MAYFETKAFEFRPSEPFTWASGIKAPCYCDNRKLLSYPKLRQRFISALVEHIESLKLDFQVVAGVATAGIPWASFLAQVLEKPLVYIRATAKAHGKKSAIEGDLKGASRVLLIEDLVSTGKSSLQAKMQLTENKHEVVGLVSLFSYQLKSAKENMQSTNTQFFPLLNLDHLIEFSRHLTEQDLAVLRAFQLEN